MHTKWVVYYSTLGGILLTQYIEAFEFDNWLKQKLIPIIEEVHRMIDLPEDTWQDAQKVLAKITE